MKLLQSIKSLFFEDVPAQKEKAIEPQLFSMPEPLNSGSEAIIISCYFNPLNAPYRLTAFKKFYSQIEHLDHKIVECVIGDTLPELPDNFEKVYTKDLLWHKEALLNNIIRKLPKKYKYIFWLDADVLFTNTNWMEEAVQVMKDGANIVQPFEYCVHLEKDEFEPSFNVDLVKRDCLPANGDSSTEQAAKRRHKKVWRSFCSNHKIGLSGKKNYDIHGHVGFAWGIKREVLEEVPGLLYSRALIGGADHIMAHAAAGQIPHSCIEKSFADDIDYVNEWSKIFYAAVQGKIGFVKGDLYHIWHGDLKSRNYLNRIKEFTSKSKNITELDENGLYYAEDDDISGYILDYFVAREALIQTEDYLPEEIMTGGQTDGGGAGGTYLDNTDTSQRDNRYETVRQDNDTNYIQPDSNRYDTVRQDNDTNYIQPDSNRYDTVRQQDNNERVSNDDYSNLVQNNDPGSTFS